MTIATIPSYSDLEAAHALLSGIVIDTAFRHSPALSRLTGANVRLKYENEQRTGSFKVRGSYVKMQSLTEAARASGVVAASAGNHAQGVACHGKRLQIDTTIVMPKTTPYTKVRRTEAYGARVVLSGASFAEAARAAQALAEAERLTMIHPYDDPYVIAGQGTVGIEMLDADPDLDAIVVPVGGGGLIAGIAIAVKKRAPRTEVIGVQAEGYAALYELLRGGRMPSSGYPTLAEGIAVKSIGELNARIARDLVDDVLLVDEPSIERAVHVLLEEEKSLAEGAGAASVAALLRFPERFEGRRVGLVISGGNIDTGLLASVILRVRFQEGRVARVRVQIVDAPGALLQISRLLAEYHANVVDVSHHRAFSNLPAKCAELDFTIEMRNPSDIRSILADLRTAAFETTVLTSVLANG